MVRGCVPCTQATPSVHGTHPPFFPSFFSVLQAMIAHLTPFWILPVLGWNGHSHSHTKNCKWNAKKGPKYDPVRYLQVVFRHFCIRHFCDSTFFGFYIFVFSRFMFRGYYFDNFVIDINVFVLITCYQFFYNILKISYFL